MAKINYRSTLFGLTMLLSSGCIKQASLDYRNIKPLLVVDGLLLTDSSPCKVTLSFSGIFNNRGSQEQQFINDAKVFVKEGAGDSVQLVSQGQGEYQSQNAFYAKVGESYSLSITLADGKRYASFPEKIAPAPKDIQLDSFGTSTNFVLYDLYGIEVKIRAKDPVAEKNYYRWTSVDWISRKATGIPCGGAPCFVYCYQYYTDNNVYVLSDNFFNGGEIRYQTALTSPIYTVGSHYIEIKQLSLTQQAYEFWRLYQEQTTRTGGILDPLPAPIQGNIYNVNDSTELALGYFEASDVTSLKMIFSPIYMNAYYTLRNMPNHIAVGACYLVYPHALNDPPPGWENAHQYIVQVF